MNEASFASLSPTLLARKGGAKPAMRPQLGPLPGTSVADSLEDLGWNDMGGDAHGHEGNVVQLSPMGANDTDYTQDEPKVDAEEPVVRRQRDELVARIGKPAPAKSTRQAGKRAAFTLRLDQERHLKLRLATTLKDCSAQQLVTEALDALLGDIDGLDSLAAQMKRR